MVVLYNIKKSLTKFQIPITASLYYLHLQEWLEVFPLKQIFIFRHEDYVKDMKYILKGLFRFLGVGMESTDC